MATRKMTFSLPGDLAQKFVKRVPARERSHFLSNALERSLRDQERALVRACLAANKVPDFKAIEEEWDQIRDGLDEPWDDDSAEDQSK
jgi:hypothetical protein